MQPSNNDHIIEVREVGNTQPVQTPKAINTERTSKVHPLPTTSSASTGASQNSLPSVSAPVPANTKLVDVSLSSRVQFIRKVYILLFIQLLITAGICALSILTIYPGGFGYFQYTHIWLFYVSIGLQVFIIIALFCFKRLARTVPYNYIGLFLFTLVEAYCISGLCSLVTIKNGSPGWVVISAAITAGVTFGLTLYAMYTKDEISVLKGTLSGIPFIIIILCLSIFVFEFSILSSMLNALFGLLYCLFLVYDTREVIGGRYQALQIDDYVLGVVILYIDIVGIFVSVLASFDSDDCGGFDGNTSFGGYDFGRWKLIMLSM